jgi:diguanylate cyclase (GGDEF)-like protein
MKGLVPLSWDWILGFSPLSSLALAFVEAGSLVAAASAFCLLNLVVVFLLFLFGTPRGRRIFLALTTGLSPVQVMAFGVPAELAILHLIVIWSAAALLWVMMRRIDNEKALLLDFVRQVNGTGSFEQALSLAVRLLRDEFRYASAAVFLEKGDGAFLEMVAAEGFPPGFTRVPQTGSVQGRAFRTREPQLVEDVLQDTDYFPGRKGAGSQVSVPVLWKDRAYGVLDLQSGKVRGLGNRDIHMAQLLAGILGEAFARMRDASRLSQELDRTRILHEVVQELARSRDKRDMCNKVLALLSAKLLYPVASILSVESEAPLKLSYVASTKLSARELQRHSRQLNREGGGLVTVSASLRKVHNVPDVKVFPQYRKVGFGVEGSQLDVPILFGDRLYAVLSLERAEPFGAEDEDLMLILSRHMAVLWALFEAMEKLEAQAMQDSLTGLGNRRALEELLDLEEARLARFGGTISVVMADLANFKTINDRYGHIVGDRYLKETAACIQKNLRASDHAFRYGGDEFLLLLPGTDRGGVQEVMKRVREECRLKGDEPEGIALDFGAAVCPMDTASLRTALRLADDRMYKNKEARRAGIERS